jgi:uncharacterized membrane protein SpoIIM required for sporulation
MIQRKQTIFLLLALVAVVVCLMQPVGLFIAEGMAPSRDMYNLYVASNEAAQGSTLMVFPLFILLLLSCPLMLWAIFAFKNRMRQALLCTGCSVLCMLWIVVYCVLGYAIGIDGYSFSMTWQACLPAVALVFLNLAHRGIMADERLVRAADRIR